MKKMTLLMAGLMAGGIMSTTLNAQQLDVGLHGGYGTTWMTNSNISDQGSELDPAATFAPLLGVHAGLVLNHLLAVRMEVNYAPVIQKYKGSVDLGGGLSYELKAKEKASYLQVPLMVQLWSNNVFYFEVGPQFNFLTGGKSDVSITAFGIGVDTTVDIKSDFRKMYVSGALGLGGNFKLAQKLYLTAGLRFAYGFTDATEKFSETEFGNRTSGGGITSTYAHTKQNGDFGYKATHNATAHVLVGLSYRLGSAKVKAPRRDDEDTTLDPQAPVRLDKGSDDE